jgi:chromosome segregation ATPase
MSATSYRPNWMALPSEVRSAQSVLAETQSVLEAAQSELKSSKQAAEKASAQRTEIQNKLDSIRPHPISPLAVRLLEL